MSSPTPPRRAAASRPRRLLGAAAALALWLGAPAAARSDEDCLACHADDGTFEPAAFARSVHGQLGLSCTDCHVDLAGAEEFPHPERVGAADCATCHDDVVQAFRDSVHGYLVERGDPRAPNCTSCHGTHDTLPATDPAARTHETALQRLCADCHGASGFAVDELVKRPRSFIDHARSVHGRTGADEGFAAGCTDCHGVHDLKGAADPGARIHRTHVATTCGACHAEVQAEYERSIHGRALQAGIGDSPSCVDCHGEHLILPVSDLASRGTVGKLARETCGACHDDPRIIAKYGLRGGVVGSYVDSYHGWASRRDYQSSATCVSCHTAHAVLPAQHPDSTIHADRVVATCGQCHRGVDRNFAASYTHESASITANPINRTIRDVYRVLIIVIIGAMVVHNVVILNFYIVARREPVRRPTAVVRFNRLQIAQHLLLIVSFVLLAVTGFALRFPEAGWVQFLSWLGMSEPVRANLHRVCGVVLVLVGLSHAVHVTATRGGRRELSALLPSREDARDLRDNLKFHLRRSERPARFGRYDYSQKIEYWALVWGTVLMFLTGIVLWYPEFTVRYLPAWIVAASQTVHYYEAWLATLAILFWHLFFVIFHPEEYPMSWTWLTGKMSESSARRHHAKWYEEELAPMQRPAAGQRAANPRGREPDAGSERRAGGEDA